jgi:hypothetical protein
MESIANGMVTPSHAARSWKYSLVFDRWSAALRHDVDRALLERPSGHLSV